MGGVGVLLRLALEFLFVWGMCIGVVFGLHLLFLFLIILIFYYSYFVINIIKINEYIFIYGYLFENYNI